MSFVWRLERSVFSLLVCFYAGNFVAKVLLSWEHGQDDDGNEGDSRFLGDRVAGDFGA